MLNYIITTNVILTSISNFDSLFSHQELLLFLEFWSQAFIASLLQYELCNLSLVSFLIYLCY